MIQMSLSSSHNGEEFKHVFTIARFHSQSRRGLIRETKIPVQKLWLKMGGGLYTRGVFAGHNVTFTFVRL